MSAERKRKHNPDLKFHDDAIVNRMIHDDLARGTSWDIIIGMIPHYEKATTEGAENAVRERFLRRNPEPVKLKPAYESLDPLWRSLHHLPQKKEAKQD
jgi:hypothetical protein